MTLEQIRVLRHKLQAELTSIHLADQGLTPSVLARLVNSPPGDVIDFIAAMVSFPGQNNFFRPFCWLVISEDPELTALHIPPVEILRALTGLRNYNPLKDLENVKQHQIAARDARIDWLEDDEQIIRRIQDQMAKYKTRRESNS